MSNNTDLPEEIRAAKYEALKDAEKKIDELIRAEEKSPTARRALTAAGNEIRKLSRVYWGKVEIAAFNAAHAAYHGGGSSRGAAFVSADMKPEKL